MRCPFCSSPATLRSGATYSISSSEEDPSYEFCLEYVCGPPRRAAGYACGQLFIVITREEPHEPGWDLAPREIWHESRAPRVNGLSNLT